LKVVIDTNVLVSALLKPRGPPGKVLRLVIQGDVDVVISESILAEYHEVLQRPKFDLSSEEVQTILGLFRGRGVHAPALATSLDLPDKSDEPFLEAALATGADALVTGNKRHFPPSRCLGQGVLSPGEFLQGLGRQRLD